MQYSLIHIIHHLKNWTANLAFNMGININEHALYDLSFSTNFTGKDWWVSLYQWKSRLVYVPAGKLFKQAKFTWHPYPWKKLNYSVTNRIPKLTVIWARRLENLFTVTNRLIYKKNWIDHNDWGVFWKLFTIFTMLIKHHNYRFKCLYN